MHLILSERLRRAVRDDPEKMLDEAGLKGAVLEVGAGRGFFTIPAAARAAVQVMYAVEPDARRVDILRARASEEGLTNVKIVEGGAEDLREIADETVDSAFAMYSVHHLSDRRRAFSEVHRILKPGGRFYVRDMVRGKIMRHGLTDEDLEDVLRSEFRSAELIDRRGRYVKILLTK